jgi:hypothetical protein
VLLVVFVAHHRRGILRVQNAFAALAASSEATGDPAALTEAKQEFAAAWAEAAGGPAVPRNLPELLQIEGDSRVSVPAVSEQPVEGDVQLMLPYMLEALDAERKQLPSLADPIWNDGAALLCCACYSPCGAKRSWLVCWYLYFGGYSERLVSLRILESNR